MTGTEQRGRKLTQSGAIWIPIVVIALLVMPMMLTKRTFGADWTVHLWLVRQQQLNIEALSHPSIFVSVKSVGVFYPMFAFVGSGLYTVGGYLAILLGNRPLLAYKLLYVVGFGLAFGGMTWLSRQLGLRDWRSQVPGLVVVTSAYFITDFEGRGDLGEFMAVAAIPLLLAAGRSIFASPRARRRDSLWFVAAVFVFTGSHTITLLWGSIFIALLIVTCFLALGRVSIGPIPWSRLAVLAGSGAIGAGLNAWFLVPDVLYGLNTNIAVGRNRHHIPRPVLVKPGVMLNPFRPTDRSTLPFGRDIRVSLPWLFALWALVAAVVLWRNRERTAKRAFIGVFGLSLVYIVLITQRGVWKMTPRVLNNIQFPWRLNAYVLLLTGLLVLLALRWQADAADRLRRATSIVLVALIAFNVGVGVWQVWRARSFYVSGHFEVATGQAFLGQVVASRYDTPVSWYSHGDFRDASAPLIKTDPSRVLTVPVRAVHRSKFAGVLPVPDGPLPFSTNISSGPRFVRMTGIRAVGRTPDGSIVAVRSATAPETGPIRVTIVPAGSTLLRLGNLVSIVSAVLLIGMILSAVGSFLVGAKSPRQEVEPTR